MLPERIAHYRILEKLGEGGMGVVYRAEDEKLQRQVALKLLCIDHSHDAAAIERFHREALIASSLVHPHICSVFEFGENAGSHYMAMELLDGQNLRELCNGRPLELDRMLSIGIQIADGIDAAHEHGIIHRDIKSTNILITQSGEAKVLDFGLAKLSKKDPLTHEIDLQTVVSQPGLTVGTVTHMSPEQVAGRDLDRRSDLFSLGIVLFEMATGVLPFTGSNSMMVMQAILYKPIPDVHKLNPDLPSELARILRKLMEKDRCLRYQTARELKSDLVRLRIDAGLTRLRSADEHAAAEFAPESISTVLPAPFAVIEPWDSIAREGRDFAERGTGIMYWFRVPLGGISHPGGFRSLLQPALENRRITKILFILDSAAMTPETWRAHIVPLILNFAKRTRSSLRLEEDDTGVKGRFFDPLTERTRLSWLFTDLSQDFSPSFKIFVDDVDESVTGLAEAEIIMATLTRSVRLADGTQATVRVPDSLLRVRASADPKLVKTLRSVARRWDFLLP